MNGITVKDKYFAEGEFIDGKGIPQKSIKWLIEQGTLVKITKAEKEKKDSGGDSETKSKSGADTKKSKKGKKDPKVVDADFEDVTEKKDSDDDNKEKSA